MSQDNSKQEEQPIDETATELTEANEVPEVVQAEEAAITDELVETSAVEADTHVTKAGPKSRKAIAEAEAEAERKAKAAEKADQPKAKQAQKPNPLKRHGKKYRQSAELVDRTKLYEISEAVELAQKTATVKFDASVELHVNLGVDPRQADQMVRSSVVLPAGTGKNLRIAVLTDSKQAEAKEAGADLVGADELMAQIEKGELNFDKLVTTPDMMPKLSKLAKVLGPKGLMPNPKSGTVTTDVAKAVTEAKAGKVEFRIDKQAIVHQAIGKTSFKPEDLEANTKAMIDAIIKAKPSAAKGTYVTSMTMTTSMGPGIKLDVTKAIAAANPKK